METKIIIVPEAKAQSLVDALNNPRSESEDYTGPLGFGPNTVGPVDSLKPLTNSPNKVTHRQITLPVDTYEGIEGGEQRLKDIVKNHNGDIVDCHPDKEGVEHASPQAHQKAKGLERMNNDNANV